MKLRIVGIFAAVIALLILATAELSDANLSLSRIFSQAKMVSIKSLFSTPPPAIEPPLISDIAGVGAPELAKNQQVITRIQYEIAYMGEVEKRDFIDTILACNPITQRYPHSEQHYQYVAESCLEGIREHNLLFAKSNSKQLRDILTTVEMTANRIRLHAKAITAKTRLMEALWEGREYKEHTKTVSDRLESRVKMLDEHSSLVRIIRFLEHAILIEPTVSGSHSDAKE